MTMHGIAEDTNEAAVTRPPNGAFEPVALRQVRLELAHERDRRLQAERRAAHGPQTEAPLPVATAVFGTAEMAVREALVMALTDVNPMVRAKAGSTSSGIRRPDTSAIGMATRFTTATAALGPATSPHISQI